MVGVFLCVSVLALRGLVLVTRCVSRLSLVVFDVETVSAVAFAMPVACWCFGQLVRFVLLWCIVVVGFVFFSV
jgi:hypothetical protein